MMTTTTTISAVRTRTRTRGVWSVMVAATALLALPAAAQPQATYSVKLLTPEAALTAAQAALAHCRQAGHQVAVAVVDRAGLLQVLLRDRFAGAHTVDVATRKAWTAARYRLATSTMEERTLAGRIVTLANDDSLPIAGGIPIVVDGHIVGAIGVSGASAAEDAAVATAALAED